MNNKIISIFDKSTYIVTSLLLLSLAYSEALKSISLAAMLLLFIYALATKQAALSRDRINASIALHALFVVIGIWVGINPEESLKQFSDVLKILLVFLFFREVNFKSLAVKQILVFLAYGFLFALLAGLYAYYLQGMDFIKLRSVGSINRSAVYMVLILMLFLPFAYREKGSGVLWRLAVVLAALGIILGASRMAMFSLPLLLLLFVYLQGALKFKYIVIVIALSTVFVILIPELFPGTRLDRRFEQGFNDPARVQLWGASIKYFLDSNPLFGIGVGNSMLIDLKVYYGPDAYHKSLDNTHQLYLDMLVERGVLGLITFVAFIGFIMQNSWVNLKKHPIHISVFLMSSSILLMGLANITFRYEFGLLFAIIAGLSLNKMLDIDHKL